MAQAKFFSMGTHRFADITSEPEVVRIKYVDTQPAKGTSNKGTIMLIHGFPQTGYQFRKVIPLLADGGYRTIVPDYRGSGDSTKPMNLSGYSKTSMATDLHTLVKTHLQIQDKIHVVGHDIGGMIAHAYAALFPADTASIIWGECPLPGTKFYQETKDSSMLWHFNFHKVLDLPELLIKGNERAYLKHFYNKLSHNPAAITPEDLDHYTNLYAQPGSMRAGINVYRLFEQDAEDNKSIRDRNGKSKVRCLTLNGAKSFLKQAAADEAQEFYEDFRVAEVDEAMHWIAEENPQAFVKETFHAKILQQSATPSAAISAKLAIINSPAHRSDGGLSSPVQLHHHKRDASTAGLDTSPGSAESPDHNDVDPRKRPVKRACNECRQQKLRCDVVQEPWQTCSRCRRLTLECKIEDNFKRIGKRSRNAEMEREIIELRKQVATQNAQQQLGLPPTLTQTTAVTNEAAAGLLDLRDGGSRGGLKRLGDVVLTLDQIHEVFQRFFKFCHPFLPFLNQDRPPEDYYSKSPLLFWTICLVGSRHWTSEQQLFPTLARQVQALVWSTLGEVPQNYHHVKALILLCAWPLPTSSTSTDATFMLAGIMMQIALQIGLHRPDHAQDFTKFRVELRQAELQDRVVTWCVCNMVAQRIATAYGQPAQTIYDWALGPKPIESNPNYELPADIYARLQIEKFVDKVSKTIYTNPTDPVGLPEDHIRSELVKLLDQDLKELEHNLEADQSQSSAMTRIYLKSAALHLHMSAFFSHRDLPSYRTDMHALYQATVDVLEACLSLESEYSINLPSNYSHGLSLSYATNYIFHIMLAAGFSLLKLMNHFLPQNGLDIQLDGATGLLKRTLWALRSASVLENDLAERLSEVLAQVWKTGIKKLDGGSASASEEPSDDLGIRVRCRMSMSVVFDSVWRWRRKFQDQRPPPDPARFFRANGEAVATDPTITATAVSMPNHSDTISTPMISGIAPVIPGMAGMPTGIADDFVTDPYASYEVFDSLNWVLDGTADFPFTFPSTSDDHTKFLSTDL
ncbi:hypothetical protein LTR05_001425 [Lithohypha guttulata]|uniref:Zn(2)-C6 fungal-type domain-containing protein n=1 Tax=Lithohypha guttulata TaxID=1690604 RepID=A0AAN7TE83_9EURO|nr:hypothetical protein LTR05_001425 [Lithohypha guttulata]